MVFTARSKRVRGNEPDQSDGMGVPKTQESERTIKRDHRNSGVKASNRVSPGPQRPHTHVFKQRLTIGCYLGCYVGAAARLR